jgi:hypothetical protein
MLLRILSPLILVLAISGCASSHMAVKSGPAVSADAGSALVVFMRPSAFGGAIQSSVCRVDDDMHDQEFIGIVSSGTKIGYRARPERHLFMVIAENADFMDAELAPGKTYHVLVSPRIGIWKARFSLLPIHNDPQAKYSSRSERFDSWQASTNFVEKGPTADQWYAENLGSINEKRTSYLRKWNGRTAEDKSDLFLHVDDGISLAPPSQERVKKT